MVQLVGKLHLGSCNCTEEDCGEKHPKCLRNLLLNHLKKVGFSADFQYGFRFWFMVPVGCLVLLQIF